MAVNKPVRRGEAGYAMLETLIAGALLVAVLAPATALLARVAIDPSNERRIRALARARAEMEEILLTRAFERAVAGTAPSQPGTRTRHDGDSVHPRREGASTPWRIERTYRRTGRRVWIRVRVFHRAQARPLADLATLRLGDDAETGASRSWN